LEEIPEETAGPYPGDGSNGPNVLTESGVVRSDITSSFGSMSGTTEGVPLTIELTVLDNANGNAAYAGAAVYLWHCTSDGNYSLYSQGVTDQNFLRGVQEADSDGKVTFTTIFPGAYSGRWPHVHFEVYPSLDKATSASNKIATSQLALPEDVCETVYSSADGYSASVRNLAQSSLESDNVFRDGVDQQMATVTGSVDAGYKATLNVPV
jgi:protocatechuate 3,4-dioxygenase beta subunit